VSSGPIRPRLPGAVLAIVLSCTPAGDMLVCKEQPDTSIKSYQRLADAISQQKAKSVTAADLYEMLKETNRRIDKLEARK